MAVIAALDSHRWGALAAARHDAGKANVIFEVINDNTEAANLYRQLIARHGVGAEDPSGIATAFEQLLTDRSRVLGPDHPDTLTTHNNLVLSPAVMHPLELAHAVNRPRIVVEYQPIVDLRSGAAVGFEALALWHHPGRGLVPLEQLIALAEGTGLVEGIGDWVLHQAVTAAGRWRQERPSDAAPYVSVNMSARQLHADRFADRVRGALDAANVPPSLLMLEISEGLWRRDNDQVWAELDELRTLGVRVVIDDFGTGFSSLSYLTQMPADVVKIDRSLTATVAHSRRQWLLLEGIIRLASTLSLDIIAEGVENEEVRALLMDLGCAFGQGHLFSRPISAEEAARWGPEGRAQDTPAHQTRFAT